MKKLIFILMIGSLFSAEQIESQEILDNINKGISIKYEDIIIIGDLNFTSIYAKNTVVPEPEKTILEKIKTFFNINIKEDKEIICNIEMPVEFSSCTFLGKVIGWENDYKYSISYKAVFKHNTIFSNCVFKDEVLFKYTEFNGQTDFSNNHYNNSTLFKYAKFSSEVNFAESIFIKEANFKYTTFPYKTTFTGSQFKSNANFKYTHFYDSVDFSNTSFNDEANFKYTKFYKGVSFKNSVFFALSNFKYTELSNPLNLEGTILKGDTDFKFTTLDGKKFIHSIIQ